MNTLLVCERSAGHVFPAVAIAKMLEKSDGSCRNGFSRPYPDRAPESSRAENKVYFFLTSDFFKKYVENEGFPVLGSSFYFRNLFIESLWRLVEAVYIIFKVRPKKVIGFGGRDSFPLVLLSSLLFIDTAIYEPNVKFGRANKILSFFVRKIFRGFKDDKTNKKVTVIGVPIRSNLKKLDKEYARKALNFDKRPVILCLGGSQGAYFVNNVFLKFVQSAKCDFQVIHITGRRNYFEILDLYNKMDISRFVKDFYYNMEILYSAADLIVSRAGASTLGEISFYNLPSVLIPHPKGGGHQEYNALYFKRRNAAFVHMQNYFSFNNFRDSLESLIYEGNLRQKMRENIGEIKLWADLSDPGPELYWL